jgi:hypothetical protein
MGLPVADPRAGPPTPPSEKPLGEWGLLADVARLQEIERTAHLDAHERADLTYTIRRLCPDREGAANAR